MTTPLAAMLGIDVPVVQAPIGSVANPRLAAAVSDAGGLGMLALTWHSADEAETAISAARGLTDRNFGVNFVLDFPVESLLRLALDAGVRVVSTFWGDAATVHPQIDAAGAVHVHVVGSVAEARAAVEAGVDVVVAQGWEAGGHVRGTTTTMSLVPAVVDAVGTVPVLAAGGVGDGRGIAAALALGAQGVWLGTRFVATYQASSHEHYRRRVVEADPEDAVHTLCFDGGWPNAPHRSLVNSTITGWRDSMAGGAAKRPGEGDVIAVEGSHHYVRYEDRVPLVGMSGSLDEMALYAGQSVGTIRSVEDAGDVVDQLMEDAAVALQAARHALSGEADGAAS